MHLPYQYVRRTVKSAVQQLVIHLLIVRRRRHILVRIHEVGVLVSLVNIAHAKALLVSMPLRVRLPVFQV